MPDPYQVLGLHPGASREQIRAAYRRLAREHHPDVSPRPDAATRFAALAAAYERLADPDSLPSSGPAGTPGGWDDAGLDISQAAAREVYDAFFRDDSADEPADAPTRAVPHPFERLPGTLDLSLDLPITVFEAAQGVQASVPTPIGPRVLSIPPGTPEARRFRMPALGARGAGGQRGDLIVRVRLVRASGTDTDTLGDR